MTFKYSTNIEERNYLPEGKYPFKTVSCVEGITRDGKDKLILKIDVFDNTGARWMQTMHITDKNTYHLKNYWDSVGKPEMFEKLCESHDEFAFIGKCGIVKTKIEENEWNGKKQIRSVIHFFVRKSDQNIQTEIPKSDDEFPVYDNEFFDDKIPF